MSREVRMGTVALRHQAEALAELFARARLRVYEGVRPDLPDLALTESKLLVELRFPDATHIKYDDEGLITAGPLEPAKAVAEGRPRWYRIVSGSDPAITILDGFCGERESEESMVMSHLWIDEDQLISCRMYVHDVRGEE